MIGIIGAICGDIIGSMHEGFNPSKIKPEYDFKIVTRYSKPTDDSACTIAVAKWLLKDTTHSKETLIKYMKDICNRFNTAGYGPMFLEWLQSDSVEPYNSFGNGSAMRVSPVAYAATTIEECLELAKITAEITHNHPEGIKGAQATALAIYMNRNGYSKQEIKEKIEEMFGYDLSRTVDDIRKTYQFEVSCQKSVPESIICWLESDSYEDCIRKCVFLGGDTDTMGAIAGSICNANPNTQISDELLIEIFETASFPMEWDEFAEIIEEFHDKYELT